VEARATILQPLFRPVALGRVRREVCAAPRAEVSACDGFEACASLAERQLEQRIPPLGEEQIECDEDRGMLGGQSVDAAGGRVDALKKLLEGGRAVDR